MKIEDLIKQHYWDVSQAGSLSGLHNFYRALRAKGVKVSLNQVRKWLMSQEAYTVHRPARKKYLRNRTVAGGIDDIWQMDLVDLSKLSRFNGGIHYLITCIDVFSKYAWAIGLKNKTGDAVLKGFQQILKSGRTPNKIHTDKGKEFINSKFKKFLEEKNIHLYSLNSELKASVVERFNRTLKEKMYRYFTFKNSYKYSNVLDDFIESYNNSYHRTIKMAPNDVEKKIENKLKIATDDKNVHAIGFKTGDTVRISKHKNIFAKGYTPNWTSEYFIVDKILPRVPPVYVIKDLNGERIEGVFYKEELQKIITSDVYKIDKIIKKRKRNGINEYYVSWLGYPDSFNSWIKESDIQK